jgi:trehalose 6-phosphate phosphatase
MPKTPRKPRASIRRSTALRRKRASSSAVRRDAGFPEGSVPELAPGTAFFLDVDGTLVDFADRPHEVRIDDDLDRLLSELHGAAGGALALISGRSVSDVDRLFASRRFCVAGQHGAERRDASGMVHRHGLPLARLRTAGDTLRRFSEAHPALVLEDKGMNLALHYRLAPHLASNVHGAVQDIVKDLGEEFEVQRGKMVFEIKPSGKDKGTAIAEFMKEKPFCDRVPVFIGDDQTDEYGFRIVNRLGGHSVKVGRGPTTARWRLPDASTVRVWLWRLIERGRLDS